MLGDCYSPGFQHLAQHRNRRSNYGARSEADYTFNDRRIQLADEFAHCCIDLAKKYGDDRSYAFVNSVLGKISRSINDGKSE